MTTQTSEQDFPLPPELDSLSTFIDSHVESLAGPSSELHNIALCATKYIFDWAVNTEMASKPYLEALLSALTDTAPPQTRSRSSSKQKRSPSPIHQSPQKTVVQGTPLSSLLIDSMSSEQIWQQLDLRAARVCENLQALQGGDEDADLVGEDSHNDENEEETEEMDVDDESDGEEETDDEEEDDGSTAEENVVDLREETSEDDEPPTSMMDTIRANRRKKSSPPGQSELDDGFFDLAAFNAETNEDEVNGISARRHEFVSDEDSGEESEMDLFGPVDDVEPDEDGFGGGGGAEPFYRDFFDPPRLSKNGSQTRSKPSKVRFHEQVAVKKIKAVGKGKPVSSMDEEDSDEEDDDDS